MLPEICLVHFRSRLRPSKIGLHGFFQNGSTDLLRLARAAREFQRRLQSGQPCRVCGDRGIPADQRPLGFAANTLLKVPGLQLPRLAQSVSLRGGFRHDEAHRQSNNTAIASFNRGPEPKTWDQFEDGCEVAQSTNRLTIARPARVSRARPFFKPYGRI